VLFGVADLAQINRVSKRWIQKLAAEFGIGTRVGRVLVFTGEEAARLSGQKPSEVTISVPIHPAIADVLQEMAEQEGKNMGQFAADCLIEHLHGKVGDG